MGSCSYERLSGSCTNRGQFPHLQALQIFGDRYEAKSDNFRRESHSRYAQIIQPMACDACMRRSHAMCRLHLLIVSLTHIRSSVLRTYRSQKET